MQGQKTRKSRRGFRHTAALVGRQLKETSQTRGFLETRLLTHWEEVVGPDTAAICEPVEVSHKSGFGATLVLLTNGANAPIVEMQKTAIQERVNAVYGYSAVSRIRITQTARHGFSEQATPFKPSMRQSSEPRDSKMHERAAQTVRGVENEKLRNALQELGASVLAKQSSDKGETK